jgi:hypothetical protein
MANLPYLPGPGSRFTGEGTSKAGFFVGVWHGLLVVLTFLLSLATERIRIQSARANLCLDRTLSTIVTGRATASAW